MLIAPSEGNTAFYQNIEKEMPELESQPSKEYQEESDGYQHRQDTEEADETGGGN